MRSNKGALLNKEERKRCARAELKHVLGDPPPPICSVLSLHIYKTQQTNTNNCPHVTGVMSKVLRCEDLRAPPSSPSDDLHP